MTYAALLRALAFAADKHRYDKRKDAEASPYINHPIAVALILVETVPTVDETSLLAAILHDTVEDTQTTHEELEGAFGSEAAALVAELTDDKSLPKQERKERQIAHAAAASDRARRIKIADKICNIRDVTYAPPVDWSLQRRREYLDWAEAVVAGCRGVEPGLDELFDQALAEGRRVLGAEK